MADGGSVTVQFKADTRDFEAGLKRVKSAAGTPMTGNFRNEVSQRIAEMRRMQGELDKLDKNLAETRASGTRTAAGFAIAGIAANSLGRNLQSLGDKATAAGRAGGFLANITTGNLVGAIKAAGQASTLTSADFQKFATDATLSATAVNEFVVALERFGDTAAAEGVRAAAAMAKTRGEIMQLKQAYKDAQSSFFSGLPSPTGKQGLAPFLGGKTPSFGTSTEFDRKFTGSLNKSLQQAIAKAGTSPGKADNISTVKAGISYLSRIAKDPRIKGDARTSLYLQLGALQDELTALTKKDTIATQKVVKKKQEQVKAIQDQLVQINPSSLLGGLGQGDWLQGPMMQYAQSFGFKARPQDYVRDLKQQVQSGRGFTKNLGKIGKAGGSQNLLGELAGMGSQGQAIAAALAGKPGLVKQYSGLADKRAAIAEKLQVQSMQVTAASVIVRAGSIVGVDRNGNGQLEKQERFTVTNNGIPRRAGGPMR